MVTDVSWVKMDHHDVEWLSQLVRCCYHHRAGGGGAESLPESSRVFVVSKVVSYFFDQVLFLFRLALADLGTVVSPDTRGLEPQWSSEDF